MELVRTEIYEKLGSRIIDQPKARSIPCPSAKRKLTKWLDKAAYFPLRFRRSYNGDLPLGGRCCR